MRLIRYVLFLSVIAWSASSRGQDIATGPDKGTKPPELKVYAATGDHKDKDLDYVAERKDKPTIYVFVQADQWSRPMARFLRKLDELVNQDDNEAAVIAVWLTDDVDETKSYLPRAQESVKFQSTVLACFTGEKSGPKNWNINSTAHLSLIIVAKQKVITSFGYMSLNEGDATPAYEAFKKAREKKG